MVSVSPQRALPMTVRYRNSISDLLWFNAYTIPRLRGMQIIFLLIVLVFGYLFASTLRPMRVPVPTKYAWFTLLMVGALLFVAVTTVLFTLVSSFPRYGRAVSEEHTVSLTGEGIVEQGTHSRHTIAWAGVRRVRRTRRAVLIYLTDTAAHIIPRRAFDSSDDFDRFFRFAVERMRAAGAA
jgi:hypothetical protein